MSDRPRDGGKFSEVFHYSEGLCDQITRLSSLTRTAPKLTSHQKLQPRVLAELRWLSTFYLLTLLSEFFLFETFKLRIQRGFPRSSPHKNPGGSLQTFSVCFLIRHFQFPSSEPALPTVQCTTRNKHSHGVHVSFCHKITSQFWHANSFRR